MKKILLALMIFTCSCSKDDSASPSELPEVSIKYIFDPGGMEANISLRRFKDQYVSENISTVSIYEDVVPKDSSLYVSMIVREPNSPSIKIVVNNRTDTIIIKNKSNNANGLEFYQYQQKLPTKYFEK